MFRFLLHISPEAIIKQNELDKDDVECKTSVS